MAVHDPPRILVQRVARLRRLGRVVASLLHGVLVRVAILIPHRPVFFESLRWRLTRVQIGFAFVQVPPVHLLVRLHQNTVLFFFMTYVLVHLSYKFTKIS